MPIRAWSAFFKRKITVYESLVLSVLLYNSETWTLKVISAQRLKSFEMTCLRKIEGVTRRDRQAQEYNRSRKAGLDQRHTGNNQNTANDSSIIWACRSNGSGEMPQVGTRRLYS